jgi:hypothetical protein
VRHQQIDENQTRTNPAVQQVDRLLTVIGRKNGISALRQDGVERGRRIGVVFDDEDSTGIRHLQVRRTR